MQSAEKGYFFSYSFHKLDTHENVGKGKLLPPLLVAQGFYRIQFARFESGNVSR